MSGKSRYRGLSMAVVLIVILVVSIIGLAVATVGIQNLRFVQKDKEQMKSFYAAESGLSRAKIMLEEDNSLDGTPSELQDQSMPDEENIRYSVEIFNNLDGNMDPARTPPMGITVPSGACYIHSQGYVGSPDNKKSIRNVGVMVVRRSIFQYGFFGDDWLSFNGSIDVKAYDPITNPNVTIPNEADVGTNGTQIGAISISGAAGEIDGTGSVGPGADPQQAIEDRHGVLREGRDSLTQPIDFPEVTVPEGLIEYTPDVYNDPGNAFSFIPSAQLAFADYDTYRMKYAYLSSRQGRGRGNPDEGGGSNTLPGPGDYRSQGTLTGSITIDQPGIYVFSGVNISGRDKIDVDTSSFAPGDKVRIYVDGDISATGNSTFIVSNGYPHQVLVFGTSANCKNVNLRGNSSSNYALYAPEAAIDMRGSSSMNGALVGKTISYRGGGNDKFQYDINLNAIPDYSNLVIGSYQRF